MHAKARRREGGRNMPGVSSRSRIPHEAESIRSLAALRAFAPSREPLTARPTTRLKERIDAREGAKTRRGTEYAGRVLQVQNPSRSRIHSIPCRPSRLRAFA